MSIEKEKAAFESFDINDADNHLCHVLTEKFYEDENAGGKWIHNAGIGAPKDKAKSPEELEILRKQKHNKLINRDSDGNMIVFVPKGRNPRRRSIADGKFIDETVLFASDLLGGKWKEKGTGWTDSEKAALCVYQLPDSFDDLREGHDKDEELAHYEEWLKKQNEVKVEKERRKNRINIADEDEKKVGEALALELEPPDGEVSRRKIREAKLQKAKIKALAVAAISETKQMKEKKKEKKKEHNTGGTLEAPRVITADRRGSLSLRRSSISQFLSHEDSFMNPLEIEFEQKLNEETISKREKEKKIHSSNPPHNRRGSFTFREHKSMLSTIAPAAECVPVIGDPPKRRKSTIEFILNEETGEKLNYDDGGDETFPILEDDVNEEVNIRPSLGKRSHRIMNHRCSFSSRKQMDEIANLSCFDDEKENDSFDFEKRNQLKLEAFPSIENPVAVQPVVKKPVVKKRRRSSGSGKKRRRSSGSFELLLAAGDSLVAPGRKSALFAFNASNILKNK
eukprot:g6486.t1